MQFSLAAKVAAAALAVLALLAFGWHEYRAGEVAGAAAVQQKWDRETAAVSQATTAAVTTAASEALANYKAAGASVQQADTHKAQQAAVADDLHRQVQAYAKSNSVRASAASNPLGCVDSIPQLDADGLRIWNNANAAARGAATVQPSDSAGKPASAVRYDSSTGDTGRQPSNDAGQSRGRGAGAG